MISITICSVACYFFVHLTINLHISHTISKYVRRLLYLVMTRDVYEGLLYDFIHPDPSNNINKKNNKKKTVSFVYARVCLCVCKCVRDSFFILFFTFTRYLREISIVRNRSEVSNICNAHT